MKAEEFVKIWQEQNQNIVHIPSEYESQLMEAYANYKCSSLQYQLEKEREDKKKLEAEAIKRIRKFIRTQRYIGANEKLAVMRKRYSKTADEFYKEYGCIFYAHESGQIVGLNLKSTWHFVTLEEKISSLTEQLEKERERCKELEEENKQQADLFENMILGTSNCPECCPKCGCNKITSDGSKAWCLNEKCDFVTLDC